MERSPSRPCPPGPTFRTASSHLPRPRAHLFSPGSTLEPAPSHHTTPQDCLFPLGPAPGSRLFLAGPALGPASSHQAPPLHGSQLWHPHHF